ncbi:LysM repeat protein [Desulfitispora alkaliphila]|uniref:LysM peptidoglycan-binding domain-containing protein n=1 Tax=Desulfitispora alkaliphila TaxID=622674 RepID=UPI003D1980D4
MVKWKFNWKRICIVVIVVSFMLTPVVFALSSEKDSLTKTIVVKQGDTLWNIVREQYPYSKDIRKNIYEVRKLNYIDQHIYPGQEIIIPVNKDHYLNK